MICFQFDTLNHVSFNVRHNGCLHESCVMFFPLCGMNMKYYKETVKLNSIIGSFAGGLKIYIGKKNMSHLKYSSGAQIINYHIFRY